MSMMARGGNDRFSRMREREVRNAFRRAKEMMAKVREAKGDVSLLAEIGPYKSRGKGRGAPARRHGNPAGRYSPHQGAQECVRRAAGGWAQNKRITGLTKAQSLYPTLSFDQ